MTDERTGPTVRVHWAPTPWYLIAAGEDETRRQLREFVKPTTFIKYDELSDGDHVCTDHSICVKSLAICFICGLIIGYKINGLVG